MTAFSILNLTAGSGPQLSGESENMLGPDGEVTDFKALFSGQFSRDELKSLLQRLRAEGGNIDPRLLRALQQALEDGKDLPFAAITLPVELPSVQDGLVPADGRALLDASSAAAGRPDEPLVAQLRALIQGDGGSPGGRQGQISSVLNAVSVEGEPEFDLDLSGLDMRGFHAAGRVDKGLVENQLSSLSRISQVPVRVGDTGWHQAVADRVVWMIGKGQQAVQLKLNPAHLGPMEVRLSLNQDQASVSFLSSHAAVREALEQAVPRLRDMLGQQDIQLVQVSVDQRHSQDSRESGQGEGNPQSHGAKGHKDTPSTSEDEFDIGTSMVQRGLVDAYA